MAPELLPTPPLSDNGDEMTSKQQHQIPRSVPTHLESETPNQKYSLLATLSLPSEVLAKYRNFIVKNSSSVSQIESALRSLTYLIPGRFRDAEIASESLHSSIQLLSLYHDSVLARSLSKLPGMPCAPPRDRYTKYWMRESKIYGRVGIFLQILQYTELLWEMAAKRRGEKVRWRVVVVLEMLKAFCRLILLRVTGGRMVVPPLPDREPVPEKTEVEEEEEFEEPGLDDVKRETKKDWTMPRTGLTLPSLPNPSDISNFLLTRVLTADDIKPAFNLMSKVQGSAQLAEILHILRPVFYAVAVARSKEKKSWQPWLLGMALEILARQLRRDGPGMRETALEKEEWSRRAWSMGWWSMRGAFYENVTKGAINAVAESRFVPNIIGGIVQDYQFLWENYHFASSDC